MLNLILKLLYFLFFTDLDIGDIRPQSMRILFASGSAKKITDLNADPDVRMSIRIWIWILPSLGYLNHLHFKKYSKLKK